MAAPGLSFASVPPGTGDIAALGLRGGDHDIECVNTHAYYLTLGNAHKLVDAAAANRKVGSWSTCAGALVEFAVTSADNVLDRFIIADLVTSDKLDAILAYFVAQGLAITQYTDRSFREACEVIFGRIDWSAPPAALVVTAADLISTEVPAGAIGGGVTAWRRSGQIHALAEPIRNSAYRRLRPLAMLYRLAPGLFQTATRDPADSAFSMIAVECQRAAAAAGVHYSQLPTSNHMRTGNVVWGMFKSMQPPPDLTVYEDEPGLPGGGVNFHRRLASFTQGATMMTAAGSDAATANQFRLAFVRFLPHYASKYEHLDYVLSPLLGEGEAVAGLLKLSTVLFREPRSPPSCISDLDDLEAAIATRAILLRRSDPPTSKAKIEWLETAVRDENASGASGSRSGGGGGDDVLSDTDKGSLRAQLGTTEECERMDRIRALLGEVRPNAIAIAREFTESSILALRRFGLGYPAKFEWPSHKDVFREATPFVSQWIENLTYALVANADGSVPDVARPKRLDTDVAELIRAHKFDEIDWLKLAYQVRGLRRGQSIVFDQRHNDFSELEHFEVLHELFLRLEPLLGFGRAGTANTFSQGVTRAKQHYNDHGTLGATRLTAIYALSGYASPEINFPPGHVLEKGFFDRMFMTSTEKWRPPMQSGRVTDPLPAFLVPTTSDCWQRLASEDADAKMGAAVVRAIPQFAAAAGMQSSSVGYAAGSLPPSSSAPSSASAVKRDADGDGAGSSSKRGRSASRSPSRDRGDGRASSAPGNIGSRAHVVKQRNDHCFSYGDYGPVVNKKRVAKDLGLDVKDLCWEVVMSTAKTPREREQLCTTPWDPDCLSGKKHKQETRVRQYAISHFESGRPKDGGGRDGSSKRRSSGKSPSDEGFDSTQMAVSQSAQVEARARALVLEREMTAGKSSPPPTDERRDRDKARSRSRSRSPSRSFVGRDDYDKALGRKRSGAATEADLATLTQAMRSGVEGLSSEQVERGVLGGGFYGAEIPGVSLGTAEHKALSTTATRWASALLGHPPSTLAAYYSAARQYAPGVSDLFALCPLAGALPLSEPAGLATPRWASLESLRGTSEYVGSAVMAYRAATYFTPIDLLGASASPLDVADVAVADAALSTAGSYRVGSLVPTALKEAQSKGFRREERSFDEMARVHLKEVDSLRSVFSSPGPCLSAAEIESLAQPLVVGFGLSSDEPAAAVAARVDALWAADCAEWHARIGPADLSLLPPALKLPGALASYDDERLAMVPFTTRCVPPTTVRGPPPSAQARAGEDGPVEFEGFYPPGYFRTRADPWFHDMRDYLVDALENGENATLEMPEPLIFGQHEMLAKYRGNLYEYSSSRGRYVVTDTTRVPSTHLNREFAHLFSVDHEDQEIFSILDYGVSFKADSLEFQFALPRHLQSVAGGLAAMQKDLIRKTGLGWYDVLDRPPSNPWRPQQVGHRLKRNGKGRLIINASWPHGPVSDGMGVRVHALNFLARTTEDELIGADASRMARLICRLRSTAGSPPPGCADAAAGQACGCDSPCGPCAEGAVVTDAPPPLKPGIGRVSVGNVSTSPSHPFAVYGGRGTILGNPLIMSLESERDRACDGYAALVNNPRLDPYAIAAVAGLKCHPRQASVASQHRDSYITALAAQVASGRSLMLLCHCAPYRCHLHIVSRIVLERARAMRDEWRHVGRPLASTAPRVLHLFSGPGGRHDGLAACLRKLGLRCEEVDVLVGVDLLDDGAFGRLKSVATAGGYIAVVCGWPCSTFSFARHAAAGRGRPLRSRSAGGAPLPHLSPNERGQVAVSDLLNKRGCSIMRIAHKRGAVIIGENPVDRFEGPYAGTFGARHHAVPHCPIWVTAEVRRLATDTSAEYVSFPQCAFEGASYQKYTTLLYSPRLPELAQLSRLVCGHRSHGEVALGYDEHGRSRSAGAAAYPHGLNAHLADAIAGYAARTRPRRGWLIGGAIAPQRAALAVGASAAKLPPERKILVTEYMAEDAVLKYFSILLGTFLVVQSDDFMDWFYQASLAAGSEWMVGYVLLELDKLASEYPELRFVREKVLGQGTVPGSSIGQRNCELILHIWDVIFEALDSAATAADRAGCPELDDVLRRREEAGLVAALHRRAGYTDDTRHRYVGPERARRGSKAWFITTRGFRVMMADPIKRQLGVHDLSLGTHFNSTLGVAFLEADKVDRALGQLRELVAGQLPVEQYRKLLGLLLHVSFLADMTMSSMHGMFAPLGRGGALEHGPMTLVAGPYLSSIISRAGHQWLARLATHTGAPYSAAVAAMSRRNTREPSRARVHWRSDACKEGTSHPGIAGIAPVVGAQTGRRSSPSAAYWVRPLVGDEVELPVPVTEFVGYFGNIHAFGGSTPPDCEVWTEIDALTAAYSLNNEASKSLLMQHVLREVKAALADHGDLADRIVNNHANGETNITADRPSRGERDELRALFEQAGCDLVEVPCPPAVDALLAELCVLEATRRQDAVTNKELISRYEKGDVSIQPGPACIIDYAPRSMAVGTGMTAVRASGDGDVPMLVDAADSDDEESESLEQLRQRIASGAAAARVVNRAPRSVALSIETAAEDAARSPAAAASSLASASSLAVGASGETVPTVMSQPSSLPLPARHTDTVASPPSFSPAEYVYNADPAVALNVVEEQVMGYAKLASVTLFPTEVANRLRSDESPYALKPRAGITLDSVCGAVFDTSHDNFGSNKKLDSNMKLWRQYTHAMGTPCWRPDARDLDRYEREREVILFANFIPWALAHAMRGRGGRSSAKPQSAYKAYLGVRKAHEKRLVELVSTKLVWTMTQRKCREYLEQHGGMSLVVRRKQPFTKAVYSLLMSVDGRAGPLDLRKEGTRVAFRAYTSLLRQTGFRKSEVALQSGESFTKRHASRAHLSWCLRGRIYNSPPRGLLEAPQAGDYAIVIPPVSKADATGEVWGALPIYLHYDSADPLCAFIHLARAELLFPAEGATRSRVPLITPDGINPFKGSQLDAALRAMLSGPGGVGPTAASSYSWHSARIGLACSLLASGASTAQIQSICRWQTEDSLRIYARLNADAYRALLSSAAGADVASVTTASLPPLSAELEVRMLLGLTTADFAAAAREVGAGAA